MPVGCEAGPRVVCRLVALSAAVSTLACGGRALRTGPVRVAYSPGASAASLLVADELGAFRARGVEVDWVAMSRPSGTLPELASGQLDVIVGNTSVALFSVMARGGRVRIVADRNQHRVGDCPTSAVMIRSDLDPRRLPRKVRIASTPAYTAEFLLDRIRASLGVAAEDWTFVDIPHAAEPQALARGAVDLIMTSEPHLTRLREAGLARIWLPYAEIYANLQQHVLLFGPRLLDRERELGASFLAAYLEGERALARGKTESNVALMAEALDLDPGLVRRICWMAADPELEINAPGLLDFQRWAVAKGALDRVVAVEEFWDRALAARALELLAETAN